MNVIRAGIFNFSVIIGVCLLVALNFSVAAENAGGLTIDRAEGPPLLLDVEVVDTAHSRARGLMGRLELALAGGMLFDFRQDQIVTMWMQNTYIPLDMIFIDARGEIKKIVTHTKPHSTELISSGMPVRAVLEVNAGFADAHGVKVGDIILHAVFRNRK